MYVRIALAGVIFGSFASHALAQAPAPAPQSQAAAVAQEQLLSSAQLDALVAPIALYPDALLAQMLMASTYPLEVVQAERWVAANKKLSGDQLKAAVDKQSWDASVKSLAATPPVLEMMSKNLDWTQKLGDAVLAQQSDIMDGIQRMRTRAYEAKKLSSSSQQKVTVQQNSGKQTILIEPASAETVYVPYYDPAVVYGSWPYPANPPYYFPAPSYIATGIIATGLAFGAGYALGRWTSGGYWGGNVNWGGGNINIDRVTHWEHNSQHRHGVQYRNEAVRQKFTNTSIRAGSDGRMDFRGRDGEPVLRPEQRPADRPGAGARPDRPDGDRARPAGERGRADAGRPKQRPGERTGADRGRDSRPPRASTQPKRPNAGARPPRDNTFDMQAGRAVNLQSQRGHASMARGPVGGGRAMDGAAHMGRGGMGAAGRGGLGAGRGGGRRSDIRLKNHVILLGRMENGLGFYSFAYNDARATYVGVIAQEVQEIAPRAVYRASDGYLRVDYRRLGIPFQTLEQWQASGSRIPSGAGRGRPGSAGHSPATVWKVAVP